MAPVEERAEALQKVIDDGIRDNNVMIFSKSFCPFCKKVKNLFNDKNVSFKALELDNMGQAGVEIQELLYKKTGQRTVPNVFIGGKHLGGCDDTLNAAQSPDFFIGLSSSSPASMVAPQKVIDDGIRDNNVMIFSKSYCPFCAKVKKMFNDKNVSFKALELDNMGQEGVEIQELLYKKTGQRTVPNVFIGGKHLGGCDDTLNAAQSPDFFVALSSSSSSFSTSSEVPTRSERGDFEYDVIVIGGGSGGLAASKEAAKLGLKTAVFDFVSPTPKGTTWGLGGTCVNVGCIPKKLMHQAAILGGSLADAKLYGWNLQDGSSSGDPLPATHDWAKMVTNVQDHIKGLNWGYKVQLRSQNVSYFNEQVTFVGPNTVKATKKNGDSREVTSANFIVATGGRPRYPDIPGARELGITSDDIFSLPKSPGKTLIIGASYIALETAGFLHGIGLETTVMVRSILLRGFDQQVAEKIGDYMISEGIEFVRPCVPTSLTEVSKGKIEVKAKNGDGSDYCGVFDTVVFAIGRDAETAKIGTSEIDLRLSDKNGKVLVDEWERSNVGNVYAIGDVAEGVPELTPVAIQAGRLLARRMAGVSTVKMDYGMIPTTVFTPIEYGCVGLSEEEATEKFGSVEVFHTNFWPLEWTVPKRPENACYAKIVCVKSDNNRVVGFHYLGPNAGEVTQGYSGMVKMGATKEDFDGLVGIHPTTAEVFTTMDVTKESGGDPTAAGC